MPNGNSKEKLVGGVTCIKVSKETRARLAELGNKGQTYEDVISNLLPTQIMEEETP
jgi:hypothetical protein